MKLGIICPGFERADLQRVKDLELEFVEFCVNFCANDQHEEFAKKTSEILSNCEEMGLFVGSVGRWGANKINADGSHNEAEYKADTTLIKAAAELKCPVYVCNGNYVDSISLFDNYSAIIKYFSRLIEFAKDYNIKIAVCNCRWNNYVVCDPAWSVIHGHLPELYIKFDPSHSIYAKGEDYLTEMKKWGNRFAHVHIKGSLLVDGVRLDDPPAGLDVTNWSAFMGVLYAIGYDGTLSIEPHSTVWQGELGLRGIKHTIKTIRGLMV